MSEGIADRAVNIEPRLAAMMDASRLAMVRVVIVGLGRVGFTLLRRWMEYPIAGIATVDHDTADAKDIGSLFPVTEERVKVKIGAEYAHFWNRAIQYHGFQTQVWRETMPWFWKLLEWGNLLCWCADDFGSLRDVSASSHGGVAMVGAVISEHGSYGEVAWSAPGHGMACLACSLDAARRVSRGGAPSVPADVEAIVDTMMASCLGVVLRGYRGFELFQHLLEPTHPLIVIHNRQNAFTTSTNECVPQLVRLMEVQPSCSVCRGNR